MGAQEEGTELNPTNVLVLCVDQMTTKHVGCYGDPIVKTPNIDRLAAEGTLFENCYTSSPICVPARAVMATGHHVHDIGAWDNCHPYLGEPKSWAHRLREAGNAAVSIGKLHYRNDQDDTGFSEQVVPMHVTKGGGDIKSLLRDPLPGGKERSKLVEQMGPGGSPKTDYDTKVTRLACEWLNGPGIRQEKPWTLFVSQVSPHPPLSPPQEFYDLYGAAKLPLPKLADGPLHPWIQQFRNTRNDADFMDEQLVREALVNYLGLCSFADYNIGLLLSALDASGLRDNTRIIFTSDHGDNLGARTLWSKCCMYEEAAKVPLITAGPDVPAGRTCRTGVSLIDLAPSIADGVGLEIDASWFDPSGRSLWKLAAEPDDPNRTVFAEYHAAASPSGAFMIRRGRWKLIYYVGYAPELFDLEADPEELNDLGTDPDHRSVVGELEDILRAVCDPEEQDRRAKEKQRQTIDAHGGIAEVEKMGWLQGTPVPGEEADHWR